MRVSVGPRTLRVVFGALEFGSGRELWDIQSGKNRSAFAAFLDHLAAGGPDEQLVPVVGKASYHRSPEVRAWWAQQTRYATAFRLPVKAPQLNLIERVWRYPKQKSASRRFWNDVAAVEATAEWF